MPDKTTTGLAVLSGVAVYAAHDFAHQYYGATPEAIGGVGGFIAIFTVAGVFLNAMVSEDE